MMSRHNRRIGPMKRAWCPNKDSVSFHGFRIEIIQRQRNRITRLKVTRHRVKIFLAGKPIVAYFVLIGDHHGIKPDKVSKGPKVVKNNQRTLDIQGFQRDDGLWDIEGKMIDMKSYAFANKDRGMIAAGEPLHEIHMVNLR